jgi:hypothetical protein
VSVRVGIVIPQQEIGIYPRRILGWARTVEATGFHHLDVFDHVVGADVADRPDWPGPSTHELAPLPIQRPIPIWMGGGAIPAVLERIGRLGDGWLAHEPRAGSSVVEAMEVVRASADRVGRDPGAIGLQGRIDVHGALDPDRFRRSLEAWLASGATHLSLHATGQGDVDRHLDLVPVLAELVREQVDLAPLGDLS